MRLLLLFACEGSSDFGLIANGIAFFLFCNVMLNNLGLFYVEVYVFSNLSYKILVFIL